MGDRRVDRGARPSWILKFAAEKGVFLVSHGKKHISSLFPPRKNFGKLH